MGLFQKKKLKTNNTEAKDSRFNISQNKKVSTFNTAQALQSAVQSLQSQQSSLSSTTSALQSAFQYSSQVINNSSSTFYFQRFIRSKEELENLYNNRNIISAGNLFVYNDNGVYRNLMYDGNSFIEIGGFERFPNPFQFPPETNMEKLERLENEKKDLMKSILKLNKLNTNKTESAEETNPGYDSPDLYMNNYLEKLEKVEEELEKFN